MDLEAIKLLVDFGVFILIWLVQLIIYPGFQYADPQQFKGWHDRYTSTVTVFVMPLMLGQVAVYGYQLVYQPSIILGIQVVLIAVCWLLTFGWMVQLHGQLGKGWSSEVVAKLVRKNWVRTIAWSGVFLFDLWEMIISVS